MQKTQKIFESKTKKHDKIKTLAESKLDSISNLVSKAIEDTHISHEEYQFILKEIEHYRTIKKQICTKSKHITDTITAKQREAILAQGREEGVWYTVTETVPYLKHTWIYYLSYCYYISCYE